MAFPSYQRSEYAHGSLSLTAGQTKSLAEATWENADGAMADPPSKIRGWLAVVSSGAAGLVVSETGTIVFTSPSNAFDDSSTSSIEGVYFKETSGSASATIKIRVIIGGIS